MSENTGVSVEIETTEQTTESQPAPESQASESTEQKKSHMEKSAERVRRDVERGSKQIAELAAKIESLKSERKDRLQALAAFEQLPDIQGPLLSDEERQELEGASRPAGTRVRNTLKLSEVITEVLADGPKQLNDILKGAADKGFIFGGQHRSNYQRVSSEVKKLVDGGKVKNTGTRGQYALNS